MTTMDTFISSIRQDKLEKSARIVTTNSPPMDHMHKMKEAIAALTPDDRQWFESAFPAWFKRYQLEGGTRDMNTMKWTIATMRMRKGRNRFRCWIPDMPVPQYDK